MYAKTVRLPSGTVSLLFTDIEGSTRLLHELGERYADALAHHREVLRQAFAKHHGVEVDTQGDAFFVAFPRAGDAIDAAADAQLALAAAVWPEGKPVRVRMGIHTGNPTLVADGYVGLDVHRGARICAVGHGGQVLVSEEARAATEAESIRFDFRDLGDHALKDLTEPQQLHQLIVSGLTDDFPPLRSLRPTNLPTPASSLVGRSRELEAILELVRREDVRLVTLTGAGGSGKTRLGIEAARRLLDDFPGGCFFGAFASIGESELVLPAIAQILGIRDAAVDLLVDAIGRRLAGKRLLLVLDNLEHLPKTGPIVAEILSSAAGVKVLATSRKALHVSGETLYPVPALGLPDPVGPQEAESIARSEAVSLFVERTRAVDPSFQLADDNARVVAEICARLDGLPLAIELATARLTLLSPQELLARLKKRLPMLSGGNRDLPARQQTLTATIEWSYNLLEPDPRATFEAVSVFTGSFTIEAAAAVCPSMDDNRLIGHLGTLTDLHLLARRDDEGERRLIMLETVREFGLEHLRASGLENDARVRHADYFLQLAERGRQEMRARDAAQWASLLDREHDNIRSALRWLIDAGQTETALRLAVALGLYWHYHGHFTEARGWYREALAGLDDHKSQEAGQGYVRQGIAALWQDDYSESESLLRKALTIFEELGDASGAAEALMFLGHLHTVKGHTPVGVDYCERAVKSASDAEDAHVRVRALHQLALSLMEADEAERAEAIFDEAHSRARGLGFTYEASDLLTNMSWFAYVQGNLTRAQRLGEEALATSRALGRSHVGAPVLHTLALVAMQHRELGRASDLLIEGAILSQKIEQPLDWASCVDGLAGVAAMSGDNRAAARLEGAALACLETINAPLPAFIRKPYEVHLSKARAGLVQVAWEEEAQIGRTLSPDEVLNLVRRLLK